MDCERLQGKINNTKFSTSDKPKHKVCEVLRVLFYSTMRKRISSVLKVYQLETSFLFQNCGTL